jgi:poly(3-hydroxyalkanoate) synthetase
VDTRKEPHFLDMVMIFAKVTDKVMVGLRAKLETAYKASGGKKVNIISHSMGGLLVSCFMSMNRDVSFHD